MKQKIIEFFQELPESKTDQFNKLFELYRESPDKSINTERMYNASGFSQLNLENLIYDLKKLHGIKDIELLPKPKEVVPVVLELSLSDKIIKLFTGIVPEDILIPTAEEKGQIDEWKVENLKQCFSFVLIKEYADFSVIIEKAKAEFPEFVELLVKVKEELVPVTPEDLELAKRLEVITGENEDLKSELESSEEDKTNLEEENESLYSENEELKLQIKQTESEHNGKLREEFEFLNDKDAPDIAHVLVGRKLAAWKRYQANHAKLQQIATGELVVSEEEKLRITSESVEDFADNQAIYDELNHYKENKEFLKKHSVFKTIRLQEEVEGMKPEELIAFKNSSAKYFSVNKKDLAKADEETAVKINARVDERKEKLALVNKKLGISAKK